MRRPALPLVAMILSSSCAPPASIHEDVPPSLPAARADVQPPRDELGSALTEADEVDDVEEPEVPVEMSPFELWRRREPIYELYVRHFSPEGNFKGVEARLPELKALGIGIVWLLPVNEIGSIEAVNGGEAIDAPFGNPYAIKSYERLNVEYGSDRTTQESAESDLRDLVDAAHALDMRVIIDWVPNHTAWDHAFVTEHPDWYVRDASGAIQSPPGPFRWIAQLDWQNAALREYMAAQMTSWLERFDIDGYRVDFAHHMPLEFFEMLRPRLEAVKPVFLLGEAGERAFHPVFDMTYDWKVYPRLGDVAHGAHVSVIDDALYFDHFVPYLDAPNALQMRMTYNHDDNGGWTLQDRYRGGVRTFAVLTAMLPGKPLVFDGQEAGMRVFDGTQVLDSAPLTHDPQVKIDWSDPDDYRGFYTRLLQLFRANPALHHAGFDDFRKIDTTPNDHVYAFVRRDPASPSENTVVVVLNFSDVQQHVTLQPSSNAGSIDGTYVELFSEQSESIGAGDTLTLAPWAYRVYVRGPRVSP